MNPTGWIAVSARLPDTSRPVLVAYEDSYGVLQYGLWSYDDGLWWCGDGDWSNQNDAAMPAPKFWHELPGLPGEDKP